MTQKDKIQKAFCFAARVNRMAESMMREGNDYDMSWHKSYCRQLKDASDQLLKDLK